MIIDWVATLSIAEAHIIGAVDQTRHSNPTGRPPLRGQAVYELVHNRYFREAIFPLPSRPEIEGEEVFVCVQRVICSGSG